MALAFADLVEALEDDGAGIACDLGGVVGAVVGDDVDVDELLGVVLGLEAFHELADDKLLITARDEHGIALELDFLVVWLALVVDDEHVDRVDNLVHVAQAEHEEEEHIEGVDKTRHGG